MGCASSKPSSSSKSNNKSKSSKDPKQQQQKNNKKSADSSSKSKSGQSVQPSSNGLTPNGKPHHESNSDEPIRVDKNLLDQIRKNENQVIDYIVRIVRQELNNELINKKKSGGGSAQLAAVALAAHTAQDNEDLIIDVASKAINLIEQPQPQQQPQTYSALRNALKSWPFICKIQTNKNRICDLTVDTIRNCLNAINESVSHDGRFDLVDFLNQSSISSSPLTESLTPPQTPPNTAAIVEDQESPSWNNAVLMSRAEANELARMLFLSNRARPVVHASPKQKDLYFVNKQLDNNTEITVTQQEIDDLLNTPSTQPASQIILTPPSSSSTVNGQLTAKQRILNKMLETPVLTIPYNQHHLEIDQLDSSNNENTNNNNSNEAPVEEEHELSNTDETKTVDNQPDIVVVDESTDILSQTIQTVSSFGELMTTTNEEEEENSSQQVETPVLDLPLATLIAVAKLENAALSDNNNNESNSVANDDVQLKVPDANSLQANSSVNESFEDANTSLANNNDNHVSESENKDNVDVQPEVAENNQEQNDQPAQDNQEDGGSLDPVLKQSLLDDRFYNNDSFKTAPPVNGNNVNGAAVSIQAGYKGHVARQELSQPSNEQDANIQG